jgi:predicted TPR repeat methyltransferase
VPTVTSVGRASLLEAALTAHRAAQLEEAEASYLELLNLDPADPDALHFLGLLRFHKRQPAEAEQLIRRSLTHAPRNPHAWNNLGNVLFATERLDLAADAYLNALEIDMEFGAPWKNLGECLERAGSPERAIALFQHIIETVPGFIPAYDALGRLLRIFGRPDEARAVYERWLELEPDRPTARHMLAAISQTEVPRRAADAYVQELFDAFSSDFDEKLARLEYRAPTLALQQLAASFPAEVQFDVLDAGCGTGLCGPPLRAYARHLTGLDLSERMIAKARARGCYDALIAAELGEHLKANAGAYDLIVCVDTLCYFGALEEILCSARHALRSAGALVFTVEWSEAAGECDTYELRPHGRYVHACSYVERCLAAAGFPRVDVQTAVLRKEIREDVKGLVVLAHAERGA